MVHEQPPRSITRLSHRFVFISEIGVIAILFISIHLPLIGPNLVNGDSAVYNEQIEKRILDMRTTHIGYIVLGIAANSISPFNTDTTMNLMCLVFGTAGLVALFFITLYYSNSRKLSLISVVLAMGSYSYLRGMLLSEVDVVLTALILVALALFPHRKLLAGLVYGLAMLVSPLGALMLPAFILNIRWQKREARRDFIRHIKDVIIFGLSSSAVYLPVVIYYFGNYFFGGRGIFTAPRMPWDPIVGLNRSLDFFSTKGSPYIPLFLAGLLLSLIDRTHNSRGTLSLGILVSIILSAFVGERLNGVPVQLPSFILLCAFAAMLGQLLQVSDKWLLIPLAALLLVVPASYNKVMKKIRLIERERATHLAMKAHSNPKPIFLVGLEKGWDEGMTFERVVYGRTKISRGLTWRSFKSKRRSIVKDPTDYHIWIKKKTTRNPVKLGSLKRRYRLTKSTINGTTYEVLVPKNE